MSDYPAPEVISAEPGPNGEVGTPDSDIERCDCGVLFRRGGWHRCEDMGERVEWEDYIDG
jgi:hypothetical protein